MARKAESQEHNEGLSEAAVAAKVRRFPAELQPNPDYCYEPPCEVVIDGQICVEVDAGVFPYAKAIAERGAGLAFPKGAK